MTKTEIKKAKKLAKINAENAVRSARTIGADALKTVLAVTDRAFVVGLIATEIADGKHVDEGGQAALKAADPALKTELAATLKEMAHLAEDAKVAGRLSFIARDLTAKVVEAAEPAKAAKPVLLDDIAPALIAEGKFAELSSLLCTRLVDDDVRSMLTAFGRENAEGGKALAEELHKIAEDRSLKPGKVQFLNKLADAISPRPMLEVVEQSKTAKPPRPAPSGAGPRDKDAAKRRRAELFAAYKRGDIPPEFVELDGDKIVIRVAGRMETFKAADKAA